MNVVIVAHAAIREANRAVYRRLATRGHDVTLVIPDRWKSVLGGRLSPEREPPGSPLRVVVRKRAGRSHSNLFFFPKGIADLVEPQTTAIYVDQDPAGLMAWQASRTARRRRAGLVILSIQNILKRYPPPFGAMQRHVFESAGACLAVSRECETTIRRRGFDGPVSIFNFGYDLQPLAFERRVRLRDRYGIRGRALGYVGRLVPEKGVDVALRALAGVEDVQFVVGGDGPQRGELGRLAGSLGIAERVVFTGNLAPQDALELIGALDACVLPSRTTDFWKEQFGRVLVEAMAQGVPVIGSSSGAIPETIGDAGLVFREDDPRELAARIRDAFDPARRDDLIERGLSRAASVYSLDAVTSVLERALEISLVRRSPSRARSVGAL